VSIEFVTIGEITLDDTVLEDGQVRRGQTGGGSVYSAFGIRVWGHTVGINAVIGHEYPETYLERLRACGIGTAGILRIPGWSLRLWLLHEENNRKQQVHKLQASTFAELDAVRPDPPPDYLTATGYHIAPSTPEGQMRSRDAVRAARPDAVISLDVLIEPFITARLYQDGSALRGIDVFSPSIVEVEALWPGTPLERLFPMLAEQGIGWIAVKMDTRGSVVYDAERRAAYHVPIYPADTVDATGAGDAYSGGFLTGIVDKGDVVEAGLRGTVSASFAVETWGAFGMLDAQRAEADRRLDWLRSRVERRF
jgi:ribokinase